MLIQTFEFHKYNFLFRNDDDFKGNVLSNGTFSKILAPGIRLGWIEAPERILELVAKW